MQPPKPNISKEETKAIQELKRDKEKIILTTNKGVSMVVMDKEEYIKKSEDLLKQPMYRELTTDPTNKYKNRLINLLKTIKAEGGINNITYKMLYPTGEGSPKYYGLPKICKAGLQLRTIISSRGSATYETAKDLAKILKPLVGRSPYHLQNNKDFLDSIMNIKIKPDGCIMSYDVSALFTSKPIEPAVNIINKHLEEDKQLHNRTGMTVKHISCLLEFCLKNTYFSFKGRFYEQTEEAAMGSPVSPIVANLFMEDMEVQTIRTSTTPRTLWKRLVDGTFTIIKINNRNSFLQHLNSMHHIKFTCEKVRNDGSMPFLDILITPEEDGSLKTSGSRKPAHTDLYLQWDSHHTIQSKYSVAGTLYHRATPVYTNPQLLQEEEKHLFQALRKCKYPTWAIDRAKLRSQNPNGDRTRRINKQTGQNNNNKQNLYMVVPYHQGLSERVKKSCNKFGVQVHFKGGQTIKSLIMAPKDKDPFTNKSGVIDRYKCNENGCDEEYIGESARTFAERFKEHQKAPSLIYDQFNISGHQVNINNFSIVGREDQNLIRTIKEALFIRVYDPSLNRNIGKYHLHHIWDEVLHKTSELKLKY